LPVVKPTCCRPLRKLHREKPSRVAEYHLKGRSSPRKRKPKFCKVAALAGVSEASAERESAAETLSGAPPGAKSKDLVLSGFAGV